MERERVNRTGETALSVSDELILEAMKLLAKYEGIFAEPSGLAGLMKGLYKGLIDRSETVIVPIIGSGLKDIGIVNRLVDDVPTIDPEPEELDNL